MYNSVLCMNTYAALWHCSVVGRTKRVLSHCNVPEVKKICCYFSSTMLIVSFLWTEFRKLPNSLVYSNSRSAIEGTVKKCFGANHLSNVYQPLETSLKINMATTTSFGRKSEGYAFLDHPPREYCQYKMLFGHL